MAVRSGFSIRRVVGAIAFSTAFNGVIFARLFGPLAMMKPEDVVEVTFDQPDRDDDRAELPPLDPVAPEPPPPVVEPEKPKPKPKEKPLEKVAQPTPPAPTPPPQQPPPPPPPPAPTPPPPVVKKERLKSVEQDQFPEEDENTTARYLAEKNHKVKEDRVSNSTNLVKRTDGPAPPSEQSENKADTPGGKAEMAAPGREAAPDTAEKPRPGALSMRNSIPLAEDKPQKEKREGVELNDPEAGAMPRARQGDDKKRAQAPRKGTDLRLKVDADGLDRIVGYDIAAAQRQQGVRAERSMPKGRYDRYLVKAAAMRSAIENFLPEVKPGNQQELGTRRSPFAAYIATMHRMIHKHFTFGFLQGIESAGSQAKHYADLTMWTQLEIVLKSDGSVEKTTIVRTSGNLSFDTAAIDAVMSSAPFPTPPPVIRSPNGKVYLDWKFHRDERACGTYGVDPHILTTPGENTEHDLTPVPKAENARRE
jgi:TonB family protein